MVMMSEGRKTKIVLLDDRHLEILVQPKLLANELLDLVSSHFNLKEKEYFGLTFKDETGHGHWLQWDRRVLEHEFPRRSGPLVLHFAVRFFIESISYLQDNATVELFYLQARQSLYKGALECDSETVFELAALVLQAVHSDYTDTLAAREHLKKLSVLPTHVLKEYPCLSYCEDQVISRYQKLSGCNRGICLVNYMSLVESLPTYGIHYYEVKDKSGIPWWLGLSYKGISLYDHNDRKTPRRVFAWKQLENLYFRDRKFSIEVHDPKRVVHTLSNFNLYDDAVQESVDDFDELSDAISDPTTLVSVSRRTFGPSSVNVHAWLTATPQLTKCIWTMAVAQHQFYLDRKQSELRYQPSRSLRDIAMDLCRSTSSLHSSVPSDGGGSGSGSLFNRSGSARSLNALSSSRTELRQDSVTDDSDSCRALQQDLWSALKVRKECVEMELKHKLEKLKELCLKEAEITGELSAEMPLEPGEPRPVIRRRVGTTFTLSPKVTGESVHVNDQLAKLEIEFEMQDKITAAYYKLTKDTSVAKNIRRNRHQCYRKAYNKLKDLERLLNEQRLKAGKDLMRFPSCYEDPGVFVSPVNSPAAVRRRANSQCSTHRDRVHIISPAARPGEVCITSTSSVINQHHHHLQRNISAPSSPIRVCESMTLPSRGSAAERYIYSGYQQQSSPNHRHTSQLSPGHKHSTSQHYSTPPSPDYHHQYHSASTTPTATTPTALNQMSGLMQRLIGRTERRLDVNLYHVASNHTAAYVSSESLAGASAWQQQQHWPSKHSSLEGAYRRQMSENHNLSSGSLLRLTSPASATNIDTFDAPLPRSLVSPPLYYETPPHLHGAANTSTDSSEHYHTPLPIPTSHHRLADDSHCTPTYLWSNDGLLYQQNLDGPTVPHEAHVDVDYGSTVFRNQNCVEVSKPFEMADVYKYSTRLRRASPSACSNSSGGGGTSGSTSTVCLDLLADSHSSDLPSVSSPQLTAVRHTVGQPHNYPV